MSAGNPWTDPIHYGDGVHLTCPDTAGTVKHAPGWTSCTVHGKVRPMFVPLADMGPVAKVAGACRRCAEKVQFGVAVCDACLDVADRHWGRVLSAPWAWAPMHPHEPLLATIGDLP